MSRDRERHKNPTIFESPDKGNTIYSRHIGEDIAQRKKVYENPEMLKEKVFFERWHMYKDILSASENNPALQQLLEQIETVYGIIK